MKKISGIVTDTAGEPVIGATILEKGNSSNGTITDIDGKFTLSVPSNATISITYIGYVTQEVKVGTQTSLKVALREDSKTLDEVVVVGFGTQKKANLTGAVSQVKMTDVLGDRPVLNAAAALQGTMPGLMISGGSTPGQTKNFNIRGNYSVYYDSNGNQQTTGSPLILIDNVEGDINMVNPDDIESVSVLKDAASAAIYGARAAGGVILVTTKRPNKETKFKLNYTFNMGFENSINRPEQSSLEEYLEAYLEAGYSSSYWASGQNVQKWYDYVKQYNQNPSSFDIVGDGIYVDTDGVPYFLREKDLYKNFLTTGVITNHNVSASGGTDKLRFRLSAGYNRENGPLITDKDKYVRKNISAFVSADLTKWFTQEVNLMYAQADKSMPVNGSIFNTRLISYYPEGNCPASLIVGGSDVDLPFQTSRNLILLSNPETTVTSTPRIFTKSILKPIKNLTIAFEYTFNKKDVRYDYYSGLYNYTDIQLANKVEPNLSQDKYQKTRKFTDYNAINTYANYEMDFGKHNIKLMAGFNQESSHYEYVDVVTYEQAVIDYPSFGGANGIKTPTDGYTEYTVRGAFGRINYAYADKYLLELNGRYDGSSKFPKANRFGFFPSVSVGWQVGRENFMSFASNWLSELKLRASYGSIGNQNISAYQYSPTMSVSQSNVWLHNGDKVTTIGTPSLVSSDFTWETVKTLNVGVDFGLLQGRLRGTFEWYQRETNGILAPGADIPALIGASAPLQNTADMRTRGWELSINWQDRIGDFGYRVGANLFDHKSKITSYPKASGLLKNFYTGQVLGEIWGYVSDGYYTIDDFVSEDAKNGKWTLKEGVTSIQGTNVQPGDEKFKNIDGDEKNQIWGGDGSVENTGDRKIIGNNTSRYTFGLNLGGNYKGFDLSVMMQGVGKRDYILSGASIFPFAGSGATDAIFQPLYSNQTDYWTPISTDPESPDYMVPVNPNAKLFRIYGQGLNVGSNTRSSTKYIQSAAYLRIKNVTLSYNFPKAWLNKLTIDQFKMFVSIENLATFSSLPKGYDPESMSWSYPFYRTVSFGASVTF
ncbi:SusC/RagA family TonB-linked outer membrane protein [Phocaeicola sp.]